MARPRLPVGEHGTIRYSRRGAGWVARARVRDADGRRRDVERDGASKQAATSNLQQALSGRPGFGGSDLTADSSLADVAARWLAEVDARVTHGDAAPNTPRVYRSVVSLHIAPALGELRIREVTVTRADAFMAALRAGHGVSLTRTTRTALNGILGYAARHGLIRANPMRDVARIRGEPRRPAKALSDTQREQWLSRLDADDVAVRHDLPDLTRLMLATGCRIGEALALDWASVDLDDKTVAVDHTLIRLEHGGGLARTSPKTSAGRRTLPLPGWAVDLLVRRRPLGGGPVFPSRTGGWRDPSNVMRDFRAASARAGVRLTSHVLRKTVATSLHDAGLSPREIADQLGHASLRTVEVYIGRRAVGPAGAVALEDFGVRGG